MNKVSNNKTIYIAQLYGAALISKRNNLKAQLEAIKKKGNYDKTEYRKMRKRMLDAINQCNIDIAATEKEVYQQNHQVVSAMLLAFISMDLVSEVLDNVGDTFNKLTVGNMRDELADFVTLCRKAAMHANDVVTTIDQGGNDALGLTYADIADDITARIKELIMERIEEYAQTSAGKHQFWGYH